MTDRGEVHDVAHQALALRSATESLVLLKNDGVLPLKPGVRIALVGPLADATRVLRGNYSSERTVAAVSIQEGLRQALPKANIINKVLRSISGAALFFANSTPEHRVDLAVPHARQCGDGNSRVPTLSINAMQARQ